MPRKKKAAETAVEATPKDVTAVEATPKDVQSKWDAKDVPIELRVRRAASSLAWYRAALKRRGLKAGTRETYKRQVARYEALVAALRAERDATKTESGS